MYTREPVKCRNCGKIITFVTTKTGKQMPCDGFSIWAVPDAEAGELLYFADGRAIKGREATRETDGAVNVLRPHWGTCSFIAKLRRESAAIKEAKNE